MVTRVRRYRLLLWALCAWIVLLSAGCSGVTVQRRGDPALPPDQETVYLLPFAGTLVPQSLSEAVFNSFVDTVNEMGPMPGVTSYVILKEGLSPYNRERLSGRIYMAGDIWSYHVTSGCCATQLRLTARLSLFRGGVGEPLLTITIPYERFFSHDRSTLEREHSILAGALAREMGRLLAEEFPRQRR